MWCWSCTLELTHWLLHLMMIKGPASSRAALTTERWNRQTDRRTDIHQTDSRHTPTRRRRTCSCRRDGRPSDSTDGRRRSYRHARPSSPRTTHLFLQAWPSDSTDGRRRSYRHVRPSPPTRRTWSCRRDRRPAALPWSRLRHHAPAPTQLTRPTSRITSARADGDSDGLI